MKKQQNIQHTNNPISGIHRPSIESSPESASLPQCKTKTETHPHSDQLVGINGSTNPIVPAHKQNLMRLPSEGSNCHQETISKPRENSSTIITMLQNTQTASPNQNANPNRTLQCLAKLDGHIDDLDDMIKRILARLEQIGRIITSPHQQDPDHIASKHTILEIRSLDVLLYEAEKEIKHARSEYDKLSIQLSDADFIYYHENLRPHQHRTSIAIAGSRSTPAITRLRTAKMIIASKTIGNSTRYKRRKHHQISVM